ncbi:MAG: quinol monooxygenase YgiN [Chlamydiales bacterium]|jgi:quinol monooxygenase YgiN
MNPSSLQLIVEFRCKAERLGEVEERATAFVEKTRAEPGCEDVSFYRVNEDSERFVFLARFKDVGSLEEHFEVSWREEAAEHMADILAEPARRSTLQRVA